jgi:hypothetical protein
MNPHFRNPAGRLWALLVHCQMWGSRDDPILAVLGNYLSLAPDYSGEFVDRLAAILRLPGQIRDRITAGDVPEDGIPALLEAATEAESAMAVLSRLDSPVGQFRDRYTPETLSTLKQASVWLNSPPPALEHGRGISLQDVSDVAHRLTDDAWNHPSLDTAVREFVAGHGSAVMSATGKVVVAGPDVVVGELHRLIGHLAVRPDVAAALADSGALADRIRELVSVLRRFESATQEQDTGADWQGMARLTGL